MYNDRTTAEQRLNKIPKGSILKPNSYMTNRGSFNEITGEKEEPTWMHVASAIVFVAIVVGYVIIRFNFQG